MSEPVATARPATSVDTSGPALLSVAAAARLVGCSRSTITRRIDAGLMTRTPDGELHRGDVLRVCADLLVRDDQDDGEDGDADTAGQGGADRYGHPGADTLAMAAHVEWMRDLIDEQRRAIERKDRQLAEQVEQAERREAVWLRQLDTLTTKLLPAPAEPEPSRGLWHRLVGR